MDNTEVAGDMSQMDMPPYSNDTISCIESL